MVVWDIYGDGEELRTFIVPDTEALQALYALVDEWRELDSQYVDDEIAEEAWLGFTEFLVARGFAPAPHVYERL